MDPLNSSEATSDGNKTIAVLSYFIFFLPIIAAKNSQLAMFHANQSLILLLFWVASWVIGIVIPVFGLIISFIVGLGVFVLWIMGIISAAQGQMKPLPIIGKYTLIK